jgi:probable rRNA maturation factor
MKTVQADRSRADEARPGAFLPAGEDDDAPPRRFEVTNCHPTRRVNRRALRQLFLATLRAEGRRYGEVDLVLLDAGEMRRYNREYHGSDEPTDHLGFQYEAAPGQVSGDVFVCLDTCAAQAADWGETPRRELARVVIHGALHLCGWSDTGAARRKAMSRREDELLAGAAQGASLGRWLGGGGDVA